MKRARRQLETNAAVSYGVVFVLVAKTLWGMWLYRDLTSGDTSSYFVTANRWFENYQDNILWSPLYTSFYGEMLRITHSVYGATNLHRIIIVFAAAFGVLALMRRLMSPAMALLVALWWTVLPINFDTLYEVHLFAFLPMLLVLILACSATSPVQRGVILAVLLATTALVRNETSIVLAVFTAFCLWEEARPRDRRPRTASWWRRRLVAYLGPVAVVMILIAGCYAQSIVKYPRLSASAESKHTLNMCQVYAFGYAQRHTEYKSSPWTECQPLMKATFGAGQPSLFEMLSSNPAATMTHFAWNASLVVNGFQVALFNAMSGAVNPDYAPVHGGKIYPLILSVLCGLILLGGAWSLHQSSRSAMRAMAFRHRQLLVVLAGLACTVCIVVATQRPRPSYLFAFTVCIMALVGTSADVLSRRLRAAVSDTALLVAAALILFLPFHQLTHASSRPLYTYLGRLQPYQSLLGSTDNKLLIGDYAGEIANYLQFRIDRAGTGPLRFNTFDYSVLDQWDRRKPLHEFLGERGFTALFVQPRLMSELRKLPAAQALLDGNTLYRHLSPPSDRDWGVYAMRPPPIAGTKLNTAR